MKEDSGRRGDWWTSQNWRERLQSSGNLSGIKLVLAWFVLGLLMIIGFFVGLVFLLLGWILMPLLRYGWVKRAHRQGSEGRRAGSRFEARAQSGSRRGQSVQASERVIEGEYQVRKSDPSE